VNRIAEGNRLIGHPCGTVQMNHERECRVARKIGAPADDELFSFWIEVALVEWRRIDRVEQLP